MNLPCLQLDDMQRELKEVVAAQEDSARRADAVLEEERARTSLIMRQVRGEAEQEAQAATEEASQVMSRAEQLRQAAAETEAAATRRVCTVTFLKCLLILCLDFILLDMLCFYSTICRLICCAFAVLYAALTSAY
jgi:hypothetical protein